MHPEANHFVTWVSEHLPEYFARGTSALDIGAADINGCNRYLFKGHYVGLDIAPGKNVDVVCKGSDAPFADGHFDTIISTECLEHDKFYDDTLTKAYNLLRRGGLLVLTCATDGRAEHGTLRTSPQDSLTSQLNDPTWSNYYKNLTADDIAAVFEGHGVTLSDIFLDYAFYVNSQSRDLYFVGIKRSETSAFLPRYKADHVSLVQEPRNRAIVYVLCRTVADLEKAADYYHECTWARLVFIPTTFYGQHVAYYHILPSRINEWVNAEYVGVLPWGSQAVDVADMETLVQKCLKKGADVIAFNADMEDVVSQATEKHPEFSKIWEHALKELGYGDTDIASSKDIILHFKGAWMCRPSWMVKYCDFFKKFRYAVDFAPTEVQASVWSASGVDDPLMSDDDRLRAWGMTHEPYHRLIASKIAGFYFFIKGVNVASTG